MYLIDLIDTSDVRRPIVTVACERILRFDSHIVTENVDRIYACVAQRNREHLDVSEDRANDLNVAFARSTCNDLVFSDDWAPVNERELIA